MFFLLLTFFMHIIKDYNLAINKKLPNNAFSSIFILMIEKKMVEKKIVMTIARG